LQGVFNNILGLFYPSKDKSFAKSVQGGGRFTTFLIIAAIISGFATYAAFAEIPPFGDDPRSVIWLLNIDLILVLVLVTVIARRIVALWSGRKRGAIGSRLHVRLVYIFSFLTVTPAIIMTIFSVFFLHFGIQNWFSGQVRTAINESQAVAEAYLREHQQVIRADILAMAGDIDRQAGMLIGNSDALEKVVETQSLLRNLSEAMIFDTNGRVLARSSLTFTLAFETIPDYLIERADQGEVLVLTRESDDRVRALVKLNNFSNGTYLFVGRMVDPTVLGHLNDTREAVAKYSSLERERSDLQLKAMMIFIIAALLLLFAAIWLGLSFSRHLVAPVIEMIKAADRVRAGDLTARVEESTEQDEFGVLGKTFNKMTEQIREQRNELILTNRQLDERRRFTETVLSGVSSGVIGVDEKGIITLANSSALGLLRQESDDLVEKDILKVLPDLGEYLAQSFDKPGKITQAEIPFLRDDGNRRTFLARITVDKSEDTKDAPKRAVITFDDITELEAAQRKAAWADVARRIAHEIKNPLTPIQLSAERLRRKYLGQITEDPETFSRCTDTIIQHVEDIGRMVSEFSSFARMPEPVMKNNDIVKQLKDMVVMQQQAHPQIKLETLVDEKQIPASVQCDMHQIRQAVTNIIQNAVDSLEATDKKDKTIQINLLRDDEYGVCIAVNDNGKGFPADEDLSRLSEPYVTHREKGTGLGLAIVKKIMDDHKGKLFLGVPEWLTERKDWHDIGGATIVITIPVPENAEDSGEGQIASTRAIA